MSRLFTIILLFFGLCTSAQRKFEIWNKNQLTTRLNEQFSIKVAQKIQYATTSSRLEVVYGEAYVAHRAKEWLDYGLGFRLVKSQPIHNTWITENRPLAYVNFSDQLNDFSITLGNRFEYRNFKNLNDHFRYRQALKLQFPKLTTWGMQFYTTEEAFIQLNDKGIHLLRFYGGIVAFTGKTFKLSAYYALQKAKLLNKWISSDVVGIDLAFSI